MKKTDKYIGMDVHKDTISVAIAEGGRVGEVHQYGKTPNDLHSLEKLLPKLGGEKARLHFVYEAGPTGFVIHRWLLKREIDSIVVAPSRTPQEKGPRQKTDRRDAEHLARLHCAGDKRAARDGVVRQHLTDPVVQRQISLSGQKQALNALVFFFREAMKRDLGDNGDFQRAGSEQRNRGERWAR